MEFSLIERIRSRTEQPRGDVTLGIGDDAALLHVPAGQELVAAIDTLVEGVHFPINTAPSAIGWKSLAVNLSDLAAMGAAPAWALLALTLPAPDEAFVDDFAVGFASLAKANHLALVGGDTTRGPLSISVAIHGLVPPGMALVRSGARVGDEILVTGTLGDAAAGLAALRILPGSADGSDALRAFLLDRLDRPTPRVAAGIALRGKASACIDISDGLIADLEHICNASHVGAEIDASLLPRSAALRTLYDDASAVRFALAGGDDYELCFTVPATRLAEVQSDLGGLGCQVTRIGRIVAGDGVRVRDAGGAWMSINEKGWEHFQ